MVQFTPKYYEFTPGYDVSAWALDYPKAMLSQELLKEHIRLDARMIQRAHDYFEANAKVGNHGLPNSRTIKPRHLKWARILEPKYELEDNPDDDGNFPELWVTKSGSLKKTLDEFYWYAEKVVKHPDDKCISLTETLLGRDAPEPEPTEPKPKSAPAPKRKPFVEYQTFGPTVPYELTTEELADIERRRKESEACGTPSEQTARSYLFDLIDTDPSARAILEKQARDDPKAAHHLELLKMKKSAADEAKEAESLTDSKEAKSVTIINNETSTEVDAQKEMVRQMYASFEDNDDVFQIERENFNMTESRRCHNVSTGCPTGILIEF
ncbi:unnamed protein product [Fusarium graminearum]|uniref:Uncharacterized protein n=1 Tax=Gibberella zeae TaxID=5518 RepID=A0A4E9EGN9_GIBZA|nr:unnamed protein product [Fusarium graminearum]CAG2000499.1 unnamed protein product [Fusarium graminearum]